MRDMKSLKKLAWAALGGVSLVSAAAAQDNNARFYGFLNPIVVGVNDGIESNTQLVDNSNAPSRLGIWWENELSNGTLKLNLETSLGIRGATSLSMTNKNPNFFNYSRGSLRKVEFIYGGNFGTVYLGQGSMFTDGITGADLSGTDFISTRSIDDLSGGYSFRVSGTGGSGPTVSNVFTDFQESRLGRLRYDSPELAEGLIIGASVGTNILTTSAAQKDNIHYDLGLRFDRVVGDIKYQARLGGARIQGRKGNPSNSRWSGSVSALHQPSGVNGTLSLGRQDNAGLGSRYAYAKLGIRRDWVSWGESAISADFFWANDSVTNGDDGFTWGIQGTQQVENANVDLYLSYRQHKYNSPVLASLENIGVWAAGMRWSW